MSGRWDNYYLDSEFERFWQSRLAERDSSVCMILGIGFDPRSLDAIEKISRLGNAKKAGYIATHLPPGPTTGESIAIIDELTELNEGRLKSIGGFSAEASETIRLQDEHGYATGGREILDAIETLLPKLSAYRDVIVDISGFPRTVFFPLISFLVKLADEGKLRNLHVAISEDPLLDSRIRGREYGAADYLHTFRPQERTKTVWLPVISSTEGLRLKKIHEMIHNDCLEVCPILPFPASSLRRADDVLIQLREVLFREIGISKENILLCDERSPFDIYRKILRVDDDYRDRLQITPAFGKVTPVASPLATKTLSLGMLLAAIERKLPVCYVEAGSYTVNAQDATALMAGRSNTTTDVWLTGEPYNVA